jgi:hypothetical protein
LEISVDPEDGSEASITTQDSLEPANLSLDPDSFIFTRSGSVNLAEKYFFSITESLKRYFRPQVFFFIKQLSLGLS